MNQWAHKQWKFDYYVPKFIGLPGKSQHNNASAVDLTLATMDWKEVWMGSYFDEFNEHAHYKNGRDIEASDHVWSPSEYVVLQETIPTIRNLLRSSMAEIGFLHYDEEWWHFYDPKHVHRPPITE